MTPPPVTVAEAAARLVRILEDIPQRLVLISEQDATRPLVEGRWAPKEILGHLIDSASNNHQRFVRAQLSSSLDSAGYDQADWVAAQHYVDAPWPELVRLWFFFNRHLVHVMRNVRSESLSTPVSIRGAAPVPLSFVMTDYVRHLEHHLAQILTPQPQR